VRGGAPPVCDCGFATCAGCGGEAHAPAACDGVERWRASQSSASDASSLSWSAAIIAAAIEEAIGFVRGAIGFVKGAGTCIAAGAGAGGRH
jgi:hypothetical protein